MSTNSSFFTWLRRNGWVLGIALLQFGLHLWVNAHDHFFRDELYYIAASQHLDLGYVDYPPLIALAAAFSRAVFGSSVLAFRLLPALAGAVIILVTAGIVKELGGQRPAQALAAVAIGFGPVFLGVTGLMSMDPFDQLWWTLAAWVLVRLIKYQQPHLWLLFGVIAGVGLLTKVTMSFFGFALVCGLLLTPQRKLLFNRWLLLGGLIALVIFSPYPIWQVQHGFPTLDFWKFYATGKTYPVTPLEFLVQQIVTTNPLSLPLWLAGLYLLFFTPSGKPYRALGWAYLILYAIFTIQKAKFYFLSPAYPVLFAGGACLLETLARQRPHGWRWLPSTYTGVLAVSGLIILPFSIPLLSAEAHIAYSAFWGGVSSVKQERLQEAALPQNYADRYGWQEMVAAVAQAYDSLPTNEQAQVCILASNYGEAGAIDLYGPAYGLPKAISGHNSYFIWGPRDCSGEVIITVGYPASDLSPSFQSVAEAGRVQCGYCMPYENNAPIIIGRGLKLKMQDAWLSAKNFN